MNTENPLGLSEQVRAALGAFGSGETKKKGFFIFGKAGVGKTHEAKKIKKLWEMSKNKKIEGGDIKAYFLDCSRDLKILNEKTRHYNEEMHSMLEELIHTKPWIRRNDKMLVLDDLAPEFLLNKYIYADICAILNYYYENNLPLVITSNYSLDDLTQNDAVGERIVSRILGCCNIIHFSGDVDLRV